VEAGSAGSDTTPKLIEHDPPPAPAHSIMPPEESAPPSLVTVEPARSGDATEPLPAGESQDQKQSTGA
jgi:hypothetical protein